MGLYISLLPNVNLSFFEVDQLYFCDNVILELFFKFHVEDLWWQKK
jgi:hypothetical protein